MLVILVMESFLCVFRMVLFLDIMGGFLMAIIIGLGCYAWKEGMNITFICYWGMLSLINGALDLVKTIDFSVKLPSRASMFAKDLPLEYRLQLLVMWMIPLSTLAAVPLAWRLYKDYSDGSVGPEPRFGAGLHRYASEGNGAERTGLLTPGETGGRFAVGSTFRAFEGSGQRLGGGP